ncbi:oligosaccharide flippase family protein [Flavobacterium sp. P21]|uniref:oligosaccharide flippase family protein n=1 Tax=Flavobacterium sp. P21 TaxID=3423948 RepID=UPI003D666A16
MKASSIFERFSKNKFLRQSFGTLSLRVFGALLLFGFTVFLTKTYSPKLVGQYDFVRSFLLSIGSMCLLGFDQSIIYFKGKLASQNALEELKNIYKKMVLMLFGTSLLVLLIIAVISKETINNYFSDPEVYSILLKGAGALFFSGLSILNTEVFRALDKLYVAELFRNIIKYIPLIIGSIVLFYWHEQEYLVNVFLLGFVFLAVVSTALVLVYFRKKTVLETTEKITHKEVFLKSYPIAISAMAMFLLMCFDIMFLKKYRNDETVAFYSVGVKIMTIISIIIVSINITVSAKIAELFASHKTAELSEVSRKSARLILMITLPVILLISYFSKSILSIFGHQYVVARRGIFNFAYWSGNLFGIWYSISLFEYDGKTTHFSDHFDFGSSC